MQKYLFFSLIFILFGCTAPKSARNTSQFEQLIQKNDIGKNSFVGFCLYDMQKDSYLIQYQDDKYFTPASNIKLFTFFAGLKILGNSPETRIKGLQYAVRGDSLIFWGTGDPTLLNARFRQQEIFNFLKKCDKKLFFSDSNWKDQPLGEGWAWDDYSEYYSVEKSIFPVYSNLVRCEFDASADNFTTQPPFFQPFFEKNKNLSPQSVTRNRADNRFFYNSPAEPVNIPFVTSGELVARLLSDTLRQSVAYLPNYPIPNDVKTVFSILADSLYKMMLPPSDNFLAEQILTLCANQLNNRELSNKNAIEWVLKKYLSDLSQPPRWVDGSGLSRLNLVTPRSLVELLRKIYAEVAPTKEGEKRLFNLLAVGGESGTLRTLYKMQPPFLFGKTGSLGNNHNLSGFLRSRSGKLFCFSWMNNHFMQPTAAVKSQMEKFLTDIYWKM